MERALSQAISPAEQTDYCFAAAMIDEARRSRLKFPPPNTLLAAMLEAAGDIATALMDLQSGLIARADDETECVQLAAMALRLAREGDSGFPASLPQSEPPAHDDVAAFLAGCPVADPFDAFLTDCTERAVEGELRSCTSLDLYDAYVGWARRRGVQRLSRAGVAKQMLARGFGSARSQVWRWLGLALKPAAPQRAGEEAL